VKSPRGLLWVALGFTAITSIGCPKPQSPESSGGIPPSQVADYIHLVIEADRATYTRDVVARLQDQEGVLKASEHFREEKTLPLPAQMLRMGAQRTAEKGRFRYALISSWAINKTNLPKSDFERQGLAAIKARPEQPYTGYQTVGDARYFVALYADRAVSPACVRCHNAHAESPRRDFKEGDVMGGIVISLPMPK
jgi:hypothetical protein